MGLNWKEFWIECAASVPDVALGALAVGLDKTQYGEAVAVVVSMALVAVVHTLFPLTNYRKRIELLTVERESLRASLRELDVRDNHRHAHIADLLSKIGELRIKLDDMTKSRDVCRRDADKLREEARVARLIGGNRFGGAL